MNESRGLVDRPFCTHVFSHHQTQVQGNKKRKKEEEEEEKRMLYTHDNSNAAEK